FSIGAGLQVQDMAVAPGYPNSVVVSRMNPELGTKHVGVSIYDDGVARPRATSRPTYSESLAYSGSASTLYAFGNESSDFVFWTDQVGTNGITPVAHTQGVISGFGVNIKFAAGRVYASSGAVVDPQSLSLVGAFQGVGLGVF